MTKVASIETPSTAWRRDSAKFRTYIDQNATFDVDLRAELIEARNSVCIEVKTDIAEPLISSQRQVLTLTAADAVRLWRDLGGIIQRRRWIK